jgi:hypothetical protein
MRGKVEAYSIIPIMGIPFLISPCVASTPFCSKVDAPGSPAEALSSAELFPVRHHIFACPSLNFEVDTWQYLMMRGQQLQQHQQCLQQGNHTCWDGMRVSVIKVNKGVNMIAMNRQFTGGGNVV